MKRRIKPDFTRPKKTLDNPRTHPTKKLRGIPEAFLLAIFVTLTEHIVEGGNLVLTTLDFTRLFVITFLTNVADNAFAVELLLQTAECLFHSFTLAQFNFY